MQKIMTLLVLSFFPLWGSDALTRVATDQSELDLGDGYTLHVAHKLPALSSENPFREALPACVDSPCASLLTDVVPENGTLETLSKGAKDDDVRRQTKYLRILTGKSDVFIYKGTENYGIVTCRFVKSDTSFHILDPTSYDRDDDMPVKLPSISLRVDFDCAFTSLSNPERSLIGVKLYNWVKGFNGREIAVPVLHDMTTLEEIGHEVRGEMRGFQCIFNITAEELS